MRATLATMCLAAPMAAAPARAAVRITVPARADGASPHQATMHYPDRNGAPVDAPFVTTRRVLDVRATADGPVRFTLRAAGRRDRVLVSDAAPYVARFEGVAPASYTLIAARLGRNGAVTARDVATGVGVGDVVVAVGDSLVQRGFPDGLLRAHSGPADERSFGDVVSAAVRHPVFLLNEGYGEIISDAYAAMIRPGGTWAATMDALRPNRALVMLGTNDGAANRVPSQLTTSLGRIVDVLERRGIASRSIILSAPPFTTRASLISQIRGFQAPVHRFVRLRRLTAGPDVFTFFENHPDLISPDQIHPSDAGFLAMDRLWARAVVANDRHARAGSGHGRAIAAACFGVALLFGAVVVARRGRRARSR